MSETCQAAFLCHRNPENGNYFGSGTKSQGNGNYFGSKSQGRLVERDPFTLRPWPIAPMEHPYSYGRYIVDTDHLVFPVKAWFERRGATRKRKAYYDQASQHNVPGQRRAIFKQLAGEAHACVAC